MTRRISPRSVANGSGADGPFADAAAFAKTFGSALRASESALAELLSPKSSGGESSPKSSKLGPEASAGTRGGTRGAARGGSGVDVHGLDGDAAGLDVALARGSSLWSALTRARGIRGTPMSLPCAFAAALPPESWPEPAAPAPNDRSADAHAGGALLHGDRPPTRARIRAPLGEVARLEASLRAAWRMSACAARRRGADAEAPAARRAPTPASLGAVAKPHATINS